MKTRIVIADDQMLFVESLKSVIESRSDFIEVVGTAANGLEAVAAVARLKPDIILLDIKMPLMDGVEATARIRKANPQTQVVILTTYDDEVFVHQALSLGAVGYLLKETHPSNLIMCLQAVNEGSVMISPEIARKLVKQLGSGAGLSQQAGTEKWLDSLTRREREVLLHLSEGLSNQKIADLLFIEEQTVRNHVSRLYAKIGVHDRLELLLMVNKKSDH
ncbi:MAG: response regulator transcription factor [Spirochaetales bacterium]